ncbi:(2Fe-2S)-binding protein [Streptomyces sp. NPDC057638]|uniref:(2Fe-2S)-binding protein n=1 Tax=Streptomyces sp. NPDC057638 TaxID=3346190 RepID=UPI0036C819AB
MSLAPALVSAGAALSCSTLLTSGYGRLTALCEALDLVVAEPHSPAAPGWVDLAELTLHPEPLESFLAMTATRMEERYAHTARPDVVASRALHGLLWSATLLISGPWYLERRVPRLRPDAVRVSRSGERYAVVPGGFWCLPDDPASALPGASVLPGETALRDAVRAEAADLARPLLAAFGPRLRRGPRALWGMVTDDLVSGIWYAGRMLGDEEDAVRAAEALLPGAVGPYPGGARFRRLTGADGTSHPTRTRLGCCLHYTVRPAEACATCPRTPDTERLRRLAEG